MGQQDWQELQRNLLATIPLYDRVNRFATLGQVSRWRRMVRGMLPDGKVLEIGCGPGSFAEDLIGHELVCLDPIPEMLKVAEERVNAARKSRGDKLAQFVIGTAEELPFEDKSFDSICSLFSFRDWYDKRQGLQECLRVLRPGGEIVIVDPAKMNWLHGMAGLIWMKVWVGTYARIVCRTPEHPWIWLPKTYTSFGTTRDNVRKISDVGV